MSFKLSSLLIFLIPLELTAVCVWAMPQVQISLDKSIYLKYEPIYLKMEKTNPLKSGVVVTPLEYDELLLEIQPPDGPKYLYRPMMHACILNSGTANENIVAFSTVILNRGNVVTDHSGSYTFSLIDRVHNSLGWPISVTVIEPTTKQDIEVKNTIEENPFQYGLFAYLEGGDHIAKGKEIFERIAAVNSGYRTKARAILAMNFSHDAIDAVTGKISRKKSIELVNTYFDGDDENVPEYLKFKTTQLIVTHFKNKDFPDRVRSQINEVKARFSGKPIPEFYKDMNEPEN
ncbi:MAG: hypothetical protein ABIQ93_13885 [Saprospiraceae bacterium]